MSLTEVPSGISELLLLYHAAVIIAFENVLAISASRLLWTLTETRPPQRPCGKEPRLRRALEEQTHELMHSLVGCICINALLLPSRLVTFLGAHHRQISRFSEKEDCQ